MKNFNRQQIFAFFCASLLNALIPQIVSNASVVTPGFDVVKSSRGITLYRTYALTPPCPQIWGAPLLIPPRFGGLGGQMRKSCLYQKNVEYVQVIDLSKGASVKLLYGDITESGKSQGAYGGDDPQLQRQTLNQAWVTFHLSNQNAFCITNGQFFSDDSKPATNLAFPVKVNGKIISDGYAGESEYPTEKLKLEIWNERADITAFNGKTSLHSSSAPNLIVGLKENADKLINKEVGRTFLGVKDGDFNGDYETILIFNSRASTQAHAALMLRSFGADKVIMLDGGGSTQLLCQGESYVTSRRTIPQMIGAIIAP